MNVVIIIFMVVSMVFSISSLTYVSVDIILEVREKKKIVPVKREEIVIEVEEPVLVPEPEIVKLEEEEILCDALYERGAGRGQMAIIHLGVLNRNFQANDVVTLAVLKEKGLVPKKIGRLKILADGELEKPLTIKAESFSGQAMKKIRLADGTVIILRD